MENIGVNYHGASSMRYMLFAGEYYYPCGGMTDFRGHYSTMCDVVRNLGSCDWFNVFDTKTGEIFDDECKIVIKKNSYDILEWAEKVDFAKR